MIFYALCLVFLATLFFSTELEARNSSFGIHYNLPIIKIFFEHLLQKTGYVLSIKNTITVSPFFSSVCID